ncbi:MAG: ABC transporter ATP-binding protein [Bacteroidota bacterium]|nr:ABC transporter ATP-binding protein [Bacteroidota bacterium]
MNDTIIEFRNVYKDLITQDNNEVIQTTILSDLNFKIQRGEFTSITGPSGSGKTTMLYLMGILDKPTKGTVVLDGQETTALSEEQLAVLRNDKLGFIFQFHFLLPEFSSLENVMMPMLARGKYTYAAAREAAKELLEQVEMGNKLNSKPNQLSGGQQQRVAIARALSNKPKVLLADEPTGNLDSKNSAIVFDLFKKLNEETNQTIIVVTHDEGFAHRTRRILHVIDGRIDYSTNI